MNLSAVSVKTFYANEDHLVLMAIVLAARECAEATRKHVDSYIEPLFATYGFRADCDEYCDGELLEHSEDLYLSGDEEQVTAFYAACDEAHKEHGYTLKPGYCPALVAENKVIQAETALLKAAAKHYDIPQFAGALSLELRAQALDLLLNPPMAA